MAKAVSKSGSRLNFFPGITRASVKRANKVGKVPDVVLPLTMQLYFFRSGSNDEQFYITDPCMYR